MAEHIKRETVINHLDACMDTIWKPEIVALKCFVEGIPAADVAPVRHGRCGMKHGVDICAECEIKFNPRYFDCECEDYFTCADCACYRCEHLHHCYGQCAKRGCAE